MTFHENVYSVMTIQENQFFKILTQLTLRRIP